jgi:Na+-transporting NADH:ubiquinone oxidoreductase subunit A
MTPIRIVKGLDLPISGAPEQVIGDGPQVSRVAVIGADHAGLRPAMQVEEGEEVKLGQPLFSDRKFPGVVFTAPACGQVEAINRGRRRALVSVVIRLDGDDAVTFQSWPASELATLRRDQVADQLMASGLWTAFRTRPFSRRANPEIQPAAIFVTAMDSNPLAARAEVIVGIDRQAFADGLDVISHLTDGMVHVCQAPRAALPTGTRDNIRAVEFAGPHPAGLAGTHIHFLDPVSANKTVWHLGCQDVIAIGKLFTTGRPCADRIVSLAGPAVRQPRLIRTRLGASIGELVADEPAAAGNRVISGSVLSGRTAAGPEAYLGRFHNQVSILEEEPASATQRRPRSGPFTTFSARVTGRPLRRRFALTTARHGETAPMVPFGGYERVMPLDVLATPLIRALLVGDSDMAQALGALELDEEDLALCAFVCPGKIDHGSLLREMLDRIEKEG